MAKSMTFVVKFLNLTERTKEEAEYTDLLDALTVAKRTSIDGKRAMSDEQFNEELIILLTSGFVYVGKKSDEYPDGEYMIELVKRLEIGNPASEEPVYGPRIIPFVAGLIPVQRDEYAAVLQFKRKTTPPVAKISDVAADQWAKSFIEDTERSTD